MNRIPTFENFNRSQFITETYELVKDHMSYDEFDELIGEGFFDWIKGLFTNPVQKRKLDKLSEDLLKTKIELMKLEIEEDAVNSIKAQLNTMTHGQSDYEATRVKVDVADRAKATKIASLQDRESAIIDQMDIIGGTSDKLQKYVDKIKFGIRIKANDATIRIADGEVERILRDLKNQDLKAVKTLDKEINN